MEKEIALYCIGSLGVLPVAYFGLRRLFKLISTPRSKTLPNKENPDLVDHFRDGNNNRPRRR